MYQLVARIAWGQKLVFYFLEKTELSRKHLSQHTGNPIPTCFFLLHGIDVPRIPIAKLTEQFQVNKRCRDELLV